MINPVEIRCPYCDKHLGSIEKGIRTQGTMRCCTCKKGFSFSTIKGIMDYLGETPNAAR